MSKEGFEGNSVVSFMVVVQGEYEAEMDAVWDQHKQFLKGTHGPWGLLSYTVAKCTEFKEPLNPASKETTGRIVYSVQEIYKDIDGLHKHYSEAANGNYVEGMLKMMSAEGNSVVIMQGTPVTHSLLPKDLEYPISIAEDNTGTDQFFE